jgi:predicted nuclease of restriction endonuclease-like (RecB) superfamily
MEIEYKNWIIELKQRIRSAQLKASIAVNEEMIRLYWDIGKSIAEKQKAFGWGSKVVEMAAADLKRELPDTNGFSRTNLFEMRKFYLFYSKNQIVHQAAGQLQIELRETENEAVNNTAEQFENEQYRIENEIVHQADGQLDKESILTKIPWQHHVVILNKCKKINEAEFYLKQTILNNWSRNILELQIASKLIDRAGKAQNNFELTLPKFQSDLAIETLKDPFKFDFLTLESNVQELELERRLTENITQFLLELGKGFAFVGRQYPLKIGNKERKIDLLFYHLKMHCYVVIDLKTGEFEPEHAGKMNYYLSAVDDLLKSETDNPSIGLILCKTKETIDVEYALRDINKPLGISTFTFNELPDNFKSIMPTVEELENEIKNLYL